MTLSVAIIGGGVSGLSAAYRLRHDAAITLFEQADYAGGHAHTVEIVEGEQRLHLDTGFVVFNERTYPELWQFFDALGVPVHGHDGGFTYFDKHAGIEFGTPELDDSSEELRSKYPEEFCRGIDDVRRFLRESPRDFIRRSADVSLAEYAAQKGYSEAFKYSHLILNATAVWSVPVEQIWRMPASTISAFFWAHDEGGLGGRRIPWRTVQGGSATYVRSALEVIRPELRLGQRVVSVRPTACGVEVTTADGCTARFDQAIVATHADEAARLVENYPERARDLLSRVPYNASRIALHRDPTVMPSTRTRWASWNYGRTVREGRIEFYAAYYLNAIHSFSSPQDYFLTIDYPGTIDASKLVLEKTSRHPVITREVREMQRDIYGPNGINSLGPIKFCGSYLHARKFGPDLLGSHESGFSSGVQAALAVIRAPSPRAS